MTNQVNSSWAKARLKYLMNLWKDVLIKLTSNYEILWRLRCSYAQKNHKIREIKENKDLSIRLYAAYI